MAAGRCCLKQNKKRKYSQDFVVVVVYVHVYDGSCWSLSESKGSEHEMYHLALSLSTGTNLKAYIPNRAQSKNNREIFTGTTSLQPTIQ